jgi:hypothetical protein
MLSCHRYVRLTLVVLNPPIMWNISNCSMKQGISTCMGNTVYNFSADAGVMCYTPVSLTLVLSLFLKESKSQFASIAVLPPAFHIIIALKYFVLLIVPLIINSGVTHLVPPIIFSHSLKTSKIRPNLCALIHALHLCL